MTPLDGIRAVVFDAVGTVIVPDPPAAMVYAEAARRHGLHLNPGEIALRLWAQYRIEEESDRADGCRTSEDRERRRWRAIVAAALPGSTDAVFDELYSHFALPSAWRVPDDAADTIAALDRHGLTLGLGSNYDSRLQAVVDGSPALHPLRRHLVISSLVGWRKPSPAFFDAVAESVGCDRSHILFVGDDFENDHLGATAAGMRSALLDPKERFAEVKQRVTKLSELLLR